MDEEIKVLQKNKTWELVELPIEKKPIGCRCVFSVKYKADGTFKRHIARLVAKSYTQTYGVDYQKPFSHVTKMIQMQYLQAHYKFTIAITN